MTDRDAGKSDEWIEMEIRGLILDPGNEAPVLILRAKSDPFFLPIWIGLPEANAIAMALEQIATPRPMTHDLLRAIVVELGAALERVEVWGLLEGTFHARICLRRGEERLEIDSRPSDAIALAVRLGASIQVARRVLDAAVASELALEGDDEERVKRWLENARPEDLGKYEM